MAILVAAALTMALSAVALAAVPLEEKQDLVDLCELGSATWEAEDSKEHGRYHERRREAIYKVYESALPVMDEGLLRYDRVTGMLTISGFREYQPRSGAPAIRFRNECFLSFEFSEEQAHDLMAQIRMGTVEVRVGYQLVARDDYDEDFCPASDSEDSPDQLRVHLLYARLIDREGGDNEEPRVIDTYQTQLGHRWALQKSARYLDIAHPSVPEVKVSHLQWRPPGKGWADDFDSDGLAETVQSLEEGLGSSIEHAVYPCYIRALAANASLQGALVLEIPVGETEGRSIDFLMDTLGEAGIRSCVEEAIATLQEGNEEIDSGDVDAFKATILMRRR